MKGQALRTVGGIDFRGRTNGIPKHGAGQAPTGRCVKVLCQRCWVTLVVHVQDKSGMVRLLRLLLLLLQLMRHSCERDKLRWSVIELAQYVVDWLE